MKSEALSGPTMDKHYLNEPSNINVVGSEEELDRDWRGGPEAGRLVPLVENRRSIHFIAC